MNVKSFNIYTLGCKVNQYDSNNLGDFLLSRGMKKIGDNSDIVFINTCSVTKSAISKNKKAINRLKRENPGAIVILMGCWPRVYDLGEIDGIDYMVNEIKSESVIGQLEEKGLSFNFSEIKDSFTSLERSRYFLKIQDGCEQFCSYCVIPYTRGKMRSREMRDILDEAKKAVKHKYEEIVLTGIHIGLYGREAESKAPLSLAGLIGELIKINGLQKIRISSIEINEVNDELLSIIDHEKVCKHLHISLQSGNDKILKLMKRPYTTKYFRDRVDIVRNKIPGISITTDVIVGFPGETDGDFLDTCSFVEKIEFSGIHVFSFSAHERTPAYGMENQVEARKIQDRSRKLREISNKLASKFRNEKRGEKVSGIIQDVDGNKLKIRSEYYFDFWTDREKVAGIAKIGKCVIVEY